jgi:hypothetical protein
MSKFILFFLLTAFVYCVQSAQATNIVVSGNVSGTWNHDTVKVTGDITVPPDSALIIEAGVLVEFYGHYKIIVKGHILASGNENKRIRFTVTDTAGFNDTLSTSGGWHGLTFDSPAASTDSSKFSFCVFEFGKAVASDTMGVNGGVFRIINFNNIIIANCRFENNLAYRWGGAMYMRNSSIVIRNCIFMNNKCGTGTVPYGYGGALCFISSKPVVLYSYFEKNSSTGVGGAASFEYSDAEVRFNIFYDNQSALGGAICYLRSNPVNVVSNNLLNQNTALFFGGGIACIRAHTKFVNNTIVNNSSSYGGGFYANDSACPRNYNTVFFGNFAYTGVEVYIWDIYSAPDFYFCNVPGGKEDFAGSGGHEGYHGIFTNNMDTIPMFVGTAYQPYTLLKESPFVDAGTYDTSSLQIPLQDLAGNSRIYNSRIDIGAFEWNPGAETDHRSETSLVSAFPNPCKENTNLFFSPDIPEKIVVRITDQQGKLVKDLGIHQFSPVNCSLKWDLTTSSGNKALPGIYFCTIAGKNVRGSIKLVVTP